MPHPFEMIAARMAELLPPPYACEVLPDLEGGMPVMRVSLDTDVGRISHDDPIPYDYVGDMLYYRGGFRLRDAVRIKDYAPIMQRLTHQWAKRKTYRQDDITLGHRTDPTLRRWIHHYLWNVNEYYMKAKSSAQDD